MKSLPVPLAQGYKYKFFDVRLNWMRVKAFFFWDKFRKMFKKFDSMFVSVTRSSRFFYLRIIYTIHRYVF